MLRGYDNEDDKYNSVRYGVATQYRFHDWLKSHCTYYFSFCFRDSSISKVICHLPGRGISETSVLLPLF